MPRAKASPKAPQSRVRRTSGTSVPKPSSGHAEELMELAVDAAQSRHLPGFLERFAERAARMLAAQWCAVMVFRGRETDSYQTSGGKLQPDAAEHTSLVRHARELAKEIEVRSLEPDAAAQPQITQTVVLVPITASDAESLGAICLVCERKTLGEAEHRLLRALASH